ncbi:hypothetical protein AZE42_04733 [Rhizopogon vesiculosus]|uniref:DUF6534 domain-containing protein n=1 Tax=Rhizopogon vesiculosus TaxID=180088 RepID=A0A1J8PKG6_9AGAM|nr:hypothetical protein AZE42_04733 [Rhizopogon vesiculosus]
MANNSTDFVWGPGLIGFTMATVFYGTALGQFIFYMQSFPRDTKKFKLFLAVIVSVSLLYYCCRFLITGDRPGSCLQFSGIFYAHRVWIITEYNRLITGIICALAVASLIFGTSCVDLLSLSQGSEVSLSLVTGGLLQWTQFATLASALCDVVITATVWWFLRPARTGNVRSKSNNYIKELTRIFIEMGLFSCLIAIMMAVFYQFQNGVIGRYYSAAPGALIGKTYLNSMMAVLNARKSIRERKDVDNSTMELPTIPTIR